MKRVAHDLVVIGAGSGGYAAARTARDLGADVALVERGPLGGLCILRGCMPSKAFLASSDLRHDALRGDALGVRVADASIDMPFIAQRKRDLVHDFAAYRIDRIMEYPLYTGEARFISENEIAVGEDLVVGASSFIIATGSSVAHPAIPGLADVGSLDSDSVLELEAIPESVILLGGGYTACELGQFLARMGAQTTVVIRSGHLLTQSDDDIGDCLTSAFRHEGIIVVDHARLLGVERRDGRKLVRLLANGIEAELEADEIFNALGRSPNVTGLNLEGIGIAFDPKNGIRVDATLRTNRRHIFAIGDVMGEYPLVHVAIYQGEIAARNAVAQAHEEADYLIVGAHTVFCDPQIAVVGKTEKQLTSERTPYVRGCYDFAEHGKAMCLAKTDGFVKMMADPQDGRILGAAVIGPQAGELIHEVIVAMSFNATAAAFARIPHLHPTLAEIWTYPAEECAAAVSQAAALLDGAVR